MHGTHTLCSPENSNMSLCLKLPVTVTAGTSVGDTVHRYTGTAHSAVWCKQVVVHYVPTRRHRVHPLTHWHSIFNKPVCKYDDGTPAQHMMSRSHCNCSRVVLQQVVQYGCSGSGTGTGQYVHFGPYSLHFPKAAIQSIPINISL